MTFKMLGFIISHTMEHCMTFEMLGFIIISLTMEHCMSFEMLGFIIISHTMVHRMTLKMLGFIIILPPLLRILWASITRKLTDRFQPNFLRTGLCLKLIIFTLNHLSNERQPC